MNEKIVNNVLRDLTISEKKRWKEIVQKPEYWSAAGDRNIFVANHLYSIYTESYKKFENELITYKINKDTLISMELFRHVLMHYGFAFECYIKSCFLKEKAISVFHQSEEYKISDIFSRHINSDTYVKYKKILPEIKNHEKKFIEYMFRAVLSGKYPFEKEPKPFDAYTTYLEETISFCKRIIDEIKKTQKL